jgi:hypothetical protein
MILFCIIQFDNFHMPVDLSNEINDEDESAFDTQSGRRSPQ